MSIVPDTYDELLSEVKDKHRIQAKDYIPKLCNALRDEDSNLSNEDITERVKKDLVDIWSRTTIYENIPDEYKKKDKQRAGKQSHKNIAEVSANPLESKVLEVSSTTSGNTVTEPEPEKPKPQENKGIPLQNLPLTLEQETMLEQSITEQQEAKVNPQSDEKVKALENKVKILEAEKNQLAIEKENVVKVKNEVLQKSKTEVTNMKETFRKMYGFEYEENTLLNKPKTDYDNVIMLDLYSARWLVENLRKNIMDQPKSPFYLVMQDHKDIKVGYGHLSTNYKKVELT